jgi:hypothetical protein
MLEVGKVYQHDGFVDPNPAYFIVLGLKTYSGHKCYVVLWGWGVMDEIIFYGQIAKNAKLIK